MNAIIISIVMLLATLATLPRCAAAQPVLPTNSPVLVHWWVANSPIGSVGYSDTVYSLDAPAPDGHYYRDRFIYLGPIGHFRTRLSGGAVCMVVVITFLLIVGGLIRWTSKRSVSHDQAT